MPAVIDDIVIEPGNARYQDVVDRFVRGEEVPYQSLRHAFDDTTQAHVWGGTMSEEVVRAVRSVNMRLPREQQLRVLLGDPPIDWDRITTRAEHWTWMEMRDSFPAALIQTEVLARQRRALVVYGGGHLQRNQIMSNYDMGHWEAQTIVSVLERTTPTRVFTIWADDDLATRHPGSASWRTPSIALVRGTALGAADFASYWSPPARFAFQDGKSVPVPRDQWRPLRMEEQFDAILYLGPSSGTERPRSPAICADRSRLDARLRRMELGAPRPEVERLKAFCASATPK